MPKGLNTELGSSKHGQGKTLCIWPPIYSTENRRPRAFFFLLLAMHGTPSTELESSKHGQDKTFCVRPPTYSTESRRLRTILFFFRPCMKLQAQSLEVQNMAHANFLVVNLLLSKLKVGCQEQKRNCFQPYLKFQAWILEVHSMVEIKKIAFGLLLSVPKVGSQDKTKLISTMHRTPSTKLKNSKHGQRQFFCSLPFTFDAESRRSKAKLVSTMFRSAWKKLEQFLFCTHPLIFYVESRRARANVFAFNHA